MKQAGPQAKEEERPSALEAASTADIVREAFEDARELVRIEVEIAKNEVRAEVDQAKRAAASLVLALGAVFVAFAMLGTAVVIAAGATVVAALVVAGVVLTVGGIAALVGYAMLPRKPFASVKQRFEKDVHELKELKERMV